jgi:hypothetical protein
LHLPIIKAKGGKPLEPGIEPLLADPVWIELLRDERVDTERANARGIAGTGPEGEAAEHVSDLLVCGLFTRDAA